MAKKNSHQIAVIGLGAFGMALVKTLIEEGANVIAVDNNMDHLDDVKDSINNTICFDATDPVQLKTHGITDVDIAVISIGENFETVVLIAMELINAGVNEVYGRANSETQELILKRVGVTEIIHPERQLAERMGISLYNKGMQDLLDLGAGLSVFEIDVPKAMVGYNLLELKLRERYQINVLTIKRPVSGSEFKYYTLGIPDGSHKMKVGDKIVVMGRKEDVNKMQEIN